MQILQDPWSEISTRELEMLSPRHALGFANGSDLVNYEDKGQIVNG